MKDQVCFYSDPWRCMHQNRFNTHSLSQIAIRQKEQPAFRPMTLGDLQQIMFIENRSYTAPWGEYLYRSELINPSGYYTVATLQNKIVGYAGMRYKFGQAHLMTLVVDPDYRGLGIGDAILSHKLKMMREKGAKSVILEVRVSNVGAQKLYRKYGFIQTGIRQRYYPDNQEDALVMTLMFSY